MTLFKNTKTAPLSIRRKISGGSHITFKIKQNLFNVNEDCEKIHNARRKTLFDGYLIK